MIKFILFIVFFILAVLLIGKYLGPNDFAKCANEPSTEHGCQAAGAIIAVSGGDTAARTEAAIDLYKNGWAPKLVFSGAAEDTSGPSNAAVMRDIAISEGVPKENILIDENSQTTKQNAEQTATLLRKNTISSVILVTSAYHQRRTYLEFTQLLKNVEIRNHPVAQDNQWSRLWWLTFGGWFLALGELARIGLFYLGVSR